MPYPAELQDKIDQITEARGGVILAKLTAGSCSGASHQATIVYTFEQQKFIWTASGYVDRFRQFIIEIGRQHSITEEQWLAMKAQS